MSANEGSVTEYGVLLAKEVKVPAALPHLQYLLGTIFTHTTLQPGTKHNTDLNLSVIRLLRPKRAQKSTHTHQDYQGRTPN